MKKFKITFKKVLLYFNFIVLKINRSKSLKERKIFNITDFYNHIESLSRDLKLGYYVTGIYGLFTFIGLISMCVYFIIK